MSKKATLWFMYVMIFLFAFGFIMYSAVMPSIRAEYRLGLSQAGWVGACLAAGQFVILLFNDWLAKHFTSMQLTLFCFVSYVLSMLAICFVPPYLALLTAFFVIGMSISLVNVTMNAQISDMFGEERDKYLSYFHGIYGVGSMLGPLLPAAAAACRLPWTSSYIVVTIIAMLTMVAFLKVDMKSGTAKANVSEKSSMALMKDKPFVIMCLAAMLFMGLDMTLCSWISIYLVDVKMATESLAGVAVTVYWLGCTAGRLSYPTLFGKINVKKYLIAVNLLTVFLVLACLWSSATVTVVLMMLVGFATGTGLPLVIGMGCARHPNSAVSVTNDEMIAGAIGGTVLPWLAGVLSDGIGYVGFIGLTIAILTGIVFLVGSLRMMEKRKEG